MPPEADAAGPGVAEPLALRLARGLAAPGAPDQAVGASVDGVPLAELAERHGTPLFVYAARPMRDALATLRHVTQGRVDVHYSVKANPNLAVVRTLADEGAGMEVASAAEYEITRRAGVPPHRVLMAGPGKTDAELEHVVGWGIGELHLEALDEIPRVAAAARAAGVVQPVALRVNPSVDAAGGAMQMGGRATAFGLDEALIEAAVDAVRAEPSLHLDGVHLYAGTQILSADVLLRQWRHAGTLAARVSDRLGRPVARLDLGGGLGVPYLDADAPLDLPALRDGFAAWLAERDRDPGLRGQRLLVEPGRWLVASAGVYVTRIVSVKVARGQCFAITDGGLHHHQAACGNLGQVIRRDFPLRSASRPQDPHDQPVTLVGPLCTPLDTWGRQARLPSPAVGDLVAVWQSGAYALTASPVGFLSHPMPAEVLVDRGEARVVRARGSFLQPLAPLP